jgi:phenylalanine-4-hydroxylase
MHKGGSDSASDHFVSLDLYVNHLATKTFLIPTFTRRGQQLSQNSTIRA